MVYTQEKPGWDSTSKKNRIQIFQYYILKIVSKSFKIALEKIFNEKFDFKLILRVDKGVKNKGESDKTWS